MDAPAMPGEHDCCSASRPCSNALVGAKPRLACRSHTHNAVVWLIMPSSVPDSISVAFIGILIPGMHACLLESNEWIGWCRVVPAIITRAHLLYRTLSCCSLVLSLLQDWCSAGARQDHLSSCSVLVYRAGLPELFNG